MRAIARPLLVTAGLLAAVCGSEADAESQDAGGAQPPSGHAGPSVAVFGVGAPLARPADARDYKPREQAEAAQRLLLAEGLEAEFVTRSLAYRGDMLVLYPDAERPSHLIVCIEQRRRGHTPAGKPGMNPGIQRVDLATGRVETILYGTDNCDGIRNTPWGTILATEESPGGRAYEFIDPLTTTGHWIADYARGDIRSAVDGSETSPSIVRRDRLPVMAWEGLAVLPNGVVYAGDELRPGEAALDDDGGALYKFLPDSPRTDDKPITDLAASPLAAGTSYALTVSCWEAASKHFPQYGQGCEVGDAAWVQVDPARARTHARANRATGYYRPEDLHLDPNYTGEGVRFCWTNTGRAEAGNYGEVMCAVDATPVPESPGLRTDKRSGLAYLADGDAYSVARVNRFVEGDPRFNSYDNLAFQPRTGNLYILEDHRHGEIIACLPDGADRDIKSDGCIAVASVADPKAEPTGLLFDASGETAYVVLQHGEQPDELLDFDSNPVDGTTDDLIRIRGFRVTR